MCTQLLPNDSVELIAPTEGRNVQWTNRTLSAWELRIDGKRIGAWRPNLTPEELADKVVSAWIDKTRRFFLLHELHLIRERIDQIHSEWVEDGSPLRPTAQTQRRKQVKEEE